jgi:murein DD-endopeptidase MepM/ murein hydrolase activator NlpD
MWVDDKKRPRHRLTERQIEAMMASSAKRRNYDYRTRRDMRYREAEIEEEEARAANRLLIRIGICIVIILFVVIVKTVDTPFTNRITNELKTALTSTMDMDSTLGQLKFVKNLFPPKEEAEQPVFNNGGDVEDTQDKSDIGRPRFVKMISPVKGEITSFFGTREHPVFKTQVEHTGIDISSFEGDDILATADGTVKETGEDPQLGRYLVLDHGQGIETLYAHCSSVTCERGQQIKQGDVIAKVGSTGNATGSHLHFEVLMDGQPVDPESWLEP